MSKGVSGISITRHITLTIATCVACSVLILGVMLAKLDIWKMDDIVRSKLPKAHLVYIDKDDAHGAYDIATQSNGNDNERVTVNNDHVTTQSANHEQQTDVDDDRTMWNYVKGSTEEMEESTDEEFEITEPPFEGTTFNTSIVQECKETKMGLEYRGELRETRHGVTCQRWDSQRPHKHMYIHGHRFIEGNVTEVGNRCRNPDNDPNGPWCYTMSARVIWDYCYLPFCRDLRSSGDRSLRPAEYAPDDCKEMWIAGDRLDGVYEISPVGVAMKAYCELDNDRRDGTKEGGWTIVQRRIDDSVDFNRNHKEYRDGFGDPTGNYWIGLDNLHRLSSMGDSQLHIYMERFDGDWAWASYDHFTISNLLSHYRVYYTNYNGTAGDAFTCDAQPGSKMLNAGFSTYDNDVDTAPDKNCAEMSMSGWWFNDKTCSCAHLNGPYQPEGTRSYFGEGVTWLMYTNYSLKKVEMKIRRM